jgi:hypothetical protein
MRWLILLAVACSGSKSPPPPTTSGPPASLTETPTQGDVQVATVNDRPVWGSCVSAQAARGASREDALKQCIDFELMAQAAEIRDLALDQEVVLATRTSLVSQLVARAYEDKYNAPMDFGPFWTRSLERNRGRFDHPEARGSVYVRAAVAKNASPEIDAEAKRTIDEIHAALVNERGLMQPHLDAIAKRVAGARPIEIAAVPADLREGRLDVTYTEALFSVPEIGRVAAPVRTPWGWDIVLWSSVVPAVHATPAEIVEQALPEIKRAFFPHWVNQVAKSLGARIEVIEKNLQQLDNL